jgi:hypothetical protein
MSAATTIHVQLDADDYDRLAAEARRRGMQPDRLVHDLIHAAFPDNETDAERTTRIGLDALDRLAELRANLRRDGYPTVDVEQLVRDGRDELDARSMR